MAGMGCRQVFEGEKLLLGVKRRSSVAGPGGPALCPDVMGSVPCPQTKGSVAYGVCPMPELSESNFLGWAPWLEPIIISATPEVESGRTAVQSQPGQKLRETPFQLANRARCSTPVALPSTAKVNEESPVPSGLSDWCGFSPDLQRWEPGDFCTVFATRYPSQRERPHGTKAQTGRSHLRLRHELTDACCSEGGDEWGLLPYGVFPPPQNPVTAGPRSPCIPCAPRVCNEAAGDLNPRPRESHRRPMSSRKCWRTACE
jgi:hypothetical protein